MKKAEFNTNINPELWKLNENRESLIKKICHFGLLLGLKSSFKKKIGFDMSLGKYDYCQASARLLKNVIN